MENTRHNGRVRYEAIQSSKVEQAPLCACGCGQKVLWCLYTKTYKTYRFNHHQRRAAVQLTARQEQIILGTMLGDGSASFVQNRRTGAKTNARLRIRHSTKRQLEYAQWLHEALLPLSGELRIRENRGFGLEVAEFNTLSHPFILEAANQAYRPQKSISREYLDRLDELGFAVWWMDDGSTQALATHAFTVAENQLIVDWLQDRWDITAAISMDKRVEKPFLQFRQPNAANVLRLVAPYVIESLWYKFGRYMPLLWSEGRLSESAARDESSRPTTSESPETTTSLPTAS
jgi:hypothetical protein